MKSAPAGGAARGVSHRPTPQLGNTLAFPWGLPTPRSSEVLHNTALVTPVTAAPSKAAPAPTTASPDPQTRRTASPGTALPAAPAYEEKHRVRPSLRRREAREAANATKGGCVHLIWDARTPPL